MHYADRQIELLETCRETQFRVQSGVEQRKNKGNSHTILSEAQQERQVNDRYKRSGAFHALKTSYLQISMTSHYRSVIESHLISTKLNPFLRDQTPMIDANQNTVTNE